MPLMLHVLSSSPLETQLQLSPMEEGSKAKLAMHNTLFAMALVFIMFLHPSESTVYTVGGDEKWSTGVNYLTWLQQYNFFVGDFLVFEYLQGEHDVYDVTNDAYHSCNETDGVYARYQSGNDTIELKEPKKYWFICNIPGHCFAGMRLKIDVAVASGLASPSPPLSLLPPASNYCKKQGIQPFSTFVVFMCVLMLFS